MLDLFVTAAWKVLVAGLVLGAGLPAVFALGVRFSAVGAGAVVGSSGAGPAGAVGPAGGPPSPGRAGYLLLGILCFVVVAVAVALGITIIVASGFGKMVSFEHVWPALVDKA